MKCGSACALGAQLGMHPLSWTFHSTPHDQALFYNYFVLFVVLPCCISVLMWFVSMSWIFSLVFFAPIALACALTYVVFLVLLRIVASIVMSSNSENRIMKLLKSMLWLFVLPDGVISYTTPLSIFCAACDYVFNLNGGTFAKLIDSLTNCTYANALCYATLLLMFAPLINYGTWLAAYIYAVNSTDEKMDALAQMYSFDFEVLRTREFALSVIFGVFSIDPTQLLSLLSPHVLVLEYLADLFRAPSFHPTHYLEGTHAFLALNLLLSLLKTGVAVVATVLEASGSCGLVRNIGFNECAGWIAVEMGAEEIDTGGRGI